MKKLIAKAALAALAGCLLAGAAAAQDTVDITVCNKTRDDVLVAISFQPVGAGKNDWLNKGWYTVLRGDCEYIAQTENGTFYAYAEKYGDSSRYWGGNFNLCVEYPGPYEFWSKRSCSRNQNSVPFTTLTTTQWGPYTWTLTP
jgi:uncharacterized membrane protein